MANKRDIAAALRRFDNRSGLAGDFESEIEIFDPPVTTDTQESEVTENESETTATSKEQRLDG